MKIGRLSVERPIGTLILAAAVMVLGLVSASRLAVDLLPSVDAPRLSITTYYPGVAPEEIETLVTRPVEQAVSTVEGVTELSGHSSEGLSRVSLRFDWGYDLETAANDVREMLDRLRARLPEGVDGPLVYKFDLSQVPIASLGLSGGGDPRRLRYLAEEILSRRMERVQGVAAVGVNGGRIRELEVRLSVARLAALGIDASAVSGALARENRNVSAGDMLDSGREVVIRAEGELLSADEVGRVVVTTIDGRPIQVQDLGEIVDGYADLQSELWIDGEPGIGLRISKRSGTNTVEVMEALQRELDAINREYEGRLRITVLSDSSDFIRAAVTNVQTSVLYGAGLAVLLLLLFLRSVRATLVVATAIPISILATFALMHAAGISLNVISLGGLALGVGMLVDGAIVILESTYRKREEGLDARGAAIEGTSEVALAVIAGALTTIAVFVPVVFIEGFAGVFFREMALVVTFALACSLLVAITVVPALSSLILTGPPPDVTTRKGLAGRINSGFATLEGGYARLLKAALRRSGTTLAIVVVILGGSLAVAPLIGVELMPETDEGEIDLNVELPVGTPLETTIEVMRSLERRAVDALREGELLHVTTVAGPEAAWRPASANQGSMEITLAPVSERARGIDDILADVRAATRGIPGAEVRIRKGTANILFRLMRGGDDRLSVEIRGHELATADRLAEQVEEVMAGIPGVGDTWVSREPGKAQRTLHVDRQRLAELGLTGASVADALEHYVLGKVATQLREGGTEYDVRVRLREEDRMNVDQLQALPLPLPAGGTIPLGSVADVRESMSPSSISRLDQERIIYVGGGIEGRALDEISGELAERLTTISVPEGFSLTLGGEQAEQDETFSGLVVGVVLALFLVYTVLVVQFESLRQPFIIVTTVPFALIGVVFTLLITGTTFNMNSFLGVIALVGIVVNNAILLVDYTNLLRTRGLEPIAALVESGRRRLRPVLMTTLTTVLGMLPLAIGIGEGSEIQAPLARAVVGGLSVSTLVTLVCVPVIYRFVSGRSPRPPIGDAVQVRPSGTVAAKAEWSA